MHCGMCLPTCPTYDETKLERNSPRGRIALMRSIADGELEATKAFADEMYFCLGCLACMTSCPAGVNYAELFEHARAEVEEKGVLDSAWRRLIRRVTLKWLFTKHTRLKMLGRLIRLYSSLGLKSLVRGSRVLKLLPKRLGELEAMTPEIQPKFSDELIRLETPAGGEKRYRVAMLTGCAQDLIFSDVNRDTVEVLSGNSCDVYTPRNQGCCGSLHAHNGEWTMAQQQARVMIDLFPPSEFDAIISNAAGCGSHLKHYHGLLKDDEKYADLARQWGRQVERCSRVVDRDRCARAKRPSTWPSAKSHLPRSLPPVPRPKDHRAAKAVAQGNPGTGTGRVAGEHVVLWQRRYLQHHPAGNGQQAARAQGRPHPLHRRGSGGDGQPRLLAAHHQRLGQVPVQHPRRPPHHPPSRGLPPGKTPSRSF